MVIRVLYFFDAHPKLVNQLEVIRWRLPPRPGARDWRGLKGGPMLRHMSSFETVVPFVASAGRNLPAIDLHRFPYCDVVYSLDNVYLVDDMLSRKYMRLKRKVNVQLSVPCVLWPNPLSPRSSQPQMT